MSSSFRYYCKTNYAKPLLRVSLSHPSRCPALAPFAINLVYCSLPVKLRILEPSHIIPPCLALLWPPRFAQFLVLKFHRRWSRRHDEKRMRTREEIPISRTCAFTVYTTCNIPHAHTRYFVIKYTVSAMCISKPQNTHMNS